MKYYQDDGYQPKTVRNPRTGRPIRVDGLTFLQLNDRERAQAISQERRQPTTTLNPQTNRAILIDGPTANTLRERHREQWQKEEISFNRVYGRSREPSYYDTPSNRQSHSHRSRHREDHEYCPEIPTSFVATDQFSTVTKQSERKSSSCIQKEPMVPVNKLPQTVLLQEPHTLKTVESSSTVDSDSSSVREIDSTQETQSEVISVQSQGAFKESTASTTAPPQEASAPSLATKKPPQASASQRGVAERAETKREKKNCKEVFQQVSIRPAEEVENEITCHVETKNEKESQQVKLQTEPIDTPRNTKQTATNSNASSLLKIDQISSPVTELRHHRGSSNENSHPPERRSLQNGMIKKKLFPNLANNDVTNEFPSKARTLKESNDSKENVECECLDCCSLM
eukprot:jgi/Galph1/3991/GphlegSOOS_G2678.1